jgi:hypothetical protein
VGFESRRYDGIAVAGSGGGEGVDRLLLEADLDGALYLGMPENTLDVWLVDRGQEPLVHAVQPERRGWPSVPFVGVIEAYVLRALRDLKLPMEEIRKAAQLVRQEFDDPYALAHRRIVTDGVALFVRMADESYVQARDRQIAISDVLEEHLKQIDWGHDGNAKRLHLRDFPAAADVIIDPRFGWGAAVLGQSKVKGGGPRDTLAERRAAWDDCRRVRLDPRRRRGCPPSSGLSSSSIAVWEGSRSRDCERRLHRPSDGRPLPGRRERCPR